MVKIIGYPAIPSYVNDNVMRNPNVHGVAVWYPYSQFNSVAGKNAMLKNLTDYLRLAKSFNKEITLLIQFGAGCGTSFYNTHSYIEYVRVRAMKPEERTFVKVPVFFDDDYFLEIVSFLKWLSDNLKLNPDAWNTLTQVKAMGVHATSLDFRADSQDWTNIYDSTQGDQAYIDMANKWLKASWNTQKAINICMEFIEQMEKYFPDKEIALPIIPNNTFPCIDWHSDICLPGERPNTGQMFTEHLMEYCDKPAPQITYFGKTLTPPDFIAKSGSEYITYQTSTQFGKLPPGSGQVIRDIIANAEKHNCNKLEIFSKTLANNPTW